MKKYLYIIFVVFAGLIVSCSNSEIYNSANKRIENSAQKTNKSINDIDFEFRQMYYQFAPKIEPYYSSLQKCRESFDKFRKHAEILRLKLMNDNNYKLAADEVDTLLVYKYAANIVFIENIRDTARYRGFVHAINERIFIQGEVSKLKNLKGSEAICFINKLETDILSAYAQLQSYFYSQIEFSCFKFNKLEAAVISEKTHYYIGETIELQLFMAATDTTQSLTVFVNNKQLPMNYGKCIYNKLITEPAGKYTWKGEIQTKSIYTGELLKYPVSGEYEVVDK